MTRPTRLLLAAGLGVLTLIPARAQQQLSPNQLTDLARQLPASAFAKPTGGVRGMALTVSSKLDPRLRDLVDASRGGADVRSRSLELGASAANLRVPVTARASNAATTTALAQEMRALGAEIWATFDTTIWAGLAPASIDQLAASANLHYLTVQEELAPVQAAAAGSGENSIRATRVQALHKSGVRGRGVKIGIIDFGYKGYRRLQDAGAVPTPKMTASFPQSQTFEGNTEHGTACAEIIYAMAPEADLYLASVAGSEGALIAAGRWLVEQGVDIISFSGGGVMQSSDGQSDMDRLVDETTQRNNVLWVIAAGNAGDKHWRGTNVDKDGDGLVDTVIPFVTGGDQFTVIVRWNDWGSDSRRPRSTQDIDAFIVAIGNDGKPELIAKSTDDQNGSGPPLERVRISTKGTGGRAYGLLLKNARTTRPLDVHVFVEGGRIAEPQPDGSISSPASASYAVAVGAWDAKTSAMARYSSRGPTDDNRLKPEIAAPAGLQSLTYGDVFDGTSAACPHVSGFAALIKTTNPPLKGQPLRAALLKAVEPKGTPVPNMASGYGWIDGERVARLAPAPPPASVPPAPIASTPPVPTTPPATPIASTPPKPTTPPATPIASAPPVATAPPSNAVPPAPAPTPAARGRVPLPVAWGGSVSTDFLDRVRMPADEPREFLTRVTTGRDLYRIGDGLKVGFKSSDKCDYLLFHRSSAGQYTLLSPRDGVVSALAPGAPYLLPSDTETFEVSLPVGVEELVLLCARQAIDLSHAGATGQAPAGLVVARHQYQVSQ
jgi:hypothetical protein